MQTVIGLVGKKRSGKSEVAKYLESTYGFVHVGFADALRETALAIDPYIVLRDAPIDVGIRLYDAIRDGKFMDCYARNAVRYSKLIEVCGYELAKEVPDMRRFLQRLGTDAVRKTFGEDVWVNALELRLAGLHDDARIVISDVRFLNEADFVRAWSASRLWRMHRDSLTHADGHQSEAELERIAENAVIYNNGTLEELHATVRTMLFSAFPHIVQQYK